MTVFSTGVIDNRKREVTHLAISVSNESTVNTGVQVEVYLVPKDGESNAVVYSLNAFSLNPFNTPGSIITFDNVYANFDRFGVRVITDDAVGSNVAVTVTGLDSAANRIFEIFPREKVVPQRIPVPPRVPRTSTNSGFTRSSGS